MRFSRLTGINLRRCFNTKPAKRSQAKITNPLPNTAGEAIVLDNGCTFINLKAKSRTIFAENLPPAVENRGGEYLTRTKIEEMQSLRRADPSRWTIHQLSKHFNVSRSMIISKALPEEEQRACAKEIDDRIMSMSTRQQKGWILRHKILQDRDAAW